ncbi:MAG: hypothetical protein EOO15_14650 [Chitinophagaceae bacterium]|nr:MAG: hypothetical protein EOO15_14650 [Chitinophagaceae bacterium]
MKSQKQCPECGGSNMFSGPPIAAAGGYGPDLLPGLGKLFSGAKFNVLLCADCGYFRSYATKETLSRLGSSSKWRRE